MKLSLRRSERICGGDGGFGQEWICRIVCRRCWFGISDGGVGVEASVHEPFSRRLFDRTVRRELILLFDAHLLYIFRINIFFYFKPISL